MRSGRTTTCVSPSGLVSVTAAPPAGRRRPWRAAAARPDPAWEADHVAFLVAHWPELAAAAFEGYARHGAGAVVLWREEATRGARRRPFEPERLWYATQVHTLPGAGPDAFDGWEAGLIEAYDPRAEAVVVFAEGPVFAGYGVAGTPRPPEALRLSRAATN